MKKKSLLFAIYCALLIQNVFCQTDMPTVQVGGFSYYLYPDGKAMITGFDQTNDTIVNQPHDLPDSLLTIPNVIIWEGDTYSVTEVGLSAFANYNNIKSVIIPEGVKTICSAAFRECRNLSKIHFPSSVSSVWDGVLDGTAWMNNQQEGLVCIDGIALTWKGRAEPNSELCISEGIRLIARRAFYEVTNLAVVSIPVSVTDIGNAAFSPQVHQMYVDCEKVPAALYGITELQTLEFGPNVKQIESDAFRFCNKLEVITFSENIEHIGYNLFLQTVWFNNLKNKYQGPFYIGHVLYRFFGEIGNDEVLSVAPGTTYMANSALANCSCLTKAYLPEGLWGIGASAFKDCPNLTEVVLPSTLTALGECVFWDCPHLERIYVQSPNPVEPIPQSTLGNACFFDTELRDHCILYVPKGSKSTYENSPAWAGKFKDIVEFNPNALTAIRELPAQPAAENPHKSSIFNPQSSIYYDLSGRPVGNGQLPKGIYIENGKKRVRK